MISCSLGRLVFHIYVESSKIELVDKFAGVLLGEFSFDRTDIESIAYEIYKTTLIVSDLTLTDVKLLIEGCLRKYEIDGTTKIALSSKDKIKSLFPPEERDLIENKMLSEAQEQLEEMESIERKVSDNKYVLKVVTYFTSSLENFLIDLGLEIDIKKLHWRLNTLGVYFYAYTIEPKVDESSIDGPDKKIVLLFSILNTEPQFKNLVDANLKGSKGIVFIFDEQSFKHKRQYENLYNAFIRNFNTFEYPMIFILFMEKETKDNEKIENEFNSLYNKLKTYAQEQGTKLIFSYNIIAKSKNAKSEFSNILSKYFWNFIKKAYMSEMKNS